MVISITKLTNVADKNGVKPNQEKYCTDFHFLFDSNQNQRKLWWTVGRIALLYCVKLFERAWILFLFLSVLHDLLLERGASRLENLHALISVTLKKQKEKQILFVSQVLIYRITYTAIVIYLSRKVWRYSIAVDVDCRSEARGEAHANITKISAKHSHENRNLFERSRNLQYYTYILQCDVKRVALNKIK